ncbi:transglycosylase-like protein with SLT domain [Lysobacter ruishenii]|uniref:Transglycosylase-like protein with SLT domain n=2 Tax=Aerolutibacter ruishenii TaxID=686800 RepID=A0A562LRQ9_9GAMM|nr:transglycosylase-like protein with SLT domain [Lysobacter ruishenii]
MVRMVPAIALVMVCGMALPTQARTVYRCMRDGTVSLATAPEPGSGCEAHYLDDNAAKVPNLWGELGTVSGALYQRVQGGKVVYSTRNLPGSTRVFGFTYTVEPSPASATPQASETLGASLAHAGLGRAGKARLDRYPVEFRKAAKASKLDEAWLRAIAHAESGYDARAESAKGAQGVMQLMPEVAREQGVRDPFSASDSINAGARHLRQLLQRYGGDYTRAAAAYNAGVGAVAKYRGVPPYRETLDYVRKVAQLHAHYRAAMGLAPLGGAH